MYFSPPPTNWLDKYTESLVWIASYPRSGNTFMRLLLANYFNDDEKDFDINALYDFIPPDTSTVLWEEFTQGCPVDSDLARIWALRPQFIEFYRRRAKLGDFAGLKTHTANVTVNGMASFNFRSSDRIIYIVRHPLDILLSYSDYNGRDLESAMEIMCRSGVCVSQGSIGGLELRGSWPEHVSSWIDAPPCPLLLIRYEELLHSTAETLRAILAFLGAPIIERRLERAAEASRFDRLREQEAARSFQETPPSARSGRFFREGRSLQWLRELSPALAYRLADHCEQAMERVGYTHPRDVLYGGRNAYKPMEIFSGEVRRRTSGIVRP